MIMSDTANTIDRSEKLASALYLITSFFNDLEPIKWRIRGLASDLVLQGSIVKDIISGNVERIKLDIRAIVIEILGQLKLARNIQLVSPDNFDLISGELYKYLDDIGLPAGLMNINGETRLSDKFFNEPFRGLPSVAHDRGNKEIQHLPALDLTNVAQESAHRRELPREVSFGAGLLPEISTRTGKLRNKLDEFGAVSVKKNSRRGTIINLLKRKKEIMIKDISPLIHGCSEKTIQRELLSMVKEGILKKEGEKRWSHYSLAIQ
jgi:hypothetical protein